MPHSPPPLPFSPVSSLQQPHSKIKAVLRSIISRGLAAFFILRSFVRLQIFRARDLTALASSPAWFLCLQPKVPPAPAGRLCPPRAPAAKPHNSTPYASTTTSLPTNRVLSPTLLREFYPKARPCNEPQLQDPPPQHAVPLPLRHDSRRKSHHVGINKFPPRASGRYTQPT